METPAKDSDDVFAEIKSKKQKNKSSNLTQELLNKRKEKQDRKF